METESFAQAHPQEISGLGYLIDDVYLDHDPGSRHPESPARLIAIRGVLEECQVFSRWKHIPARPARADEIELIHHPSLLERVEQASRRAPSYLDPDTVVSTGSFRSALFAVGGTLECVDAICSGRVRRAFAFVRPPGHHAEPDRAMGFCLFNNVALAAAYARIEHHLERVAAVDFDLHHGNGTQACFYDDPNVLYISSHQYPFYPGTGGFAEVGLKQGEGFTMNFPLPKGTGDEMFIPLYSRVVRSILEQYRSQLILVSAGFDAHFLDPLGGLRVTSAGFASVVASLIRAADDLCGGKICFLLEGGYSLEALKDCTRLIVGQMEAPVPRERSPASAPRFEEYSGEARRILGKYWNLHV
jgi:acetoin utilization deacetylase AcuC-like enzyme